MRFSNHAIVQNWDNKQTCHNHFPLQSLYSVTKHWQNNFAIFDTMHDAPFT